MGTSSRRFWLVLVVILTGPGIPCRLLGQGIDFTDRVAVENLQTTVSALAEAGGHRSRVTFTAGNDSARQWIWRRLRALALDSVWADTFFVRAANPPYNGLPQLNLLGALRGRSAPNETVVLGAHYDCSASHEAAWDSDWHRLIAPGADDNATGVAIVLEAARVLSEAGFAPERTLIFALFASEEYTPTVLSTQPDSLRHHLGSADLARRLARAGWEVRGLINVDMVGYNPDANYVEFVADERSQLLAHLGRSLIDKLDLGLESNEPPFHYHTYSDHESFVRWGFPAVLLIENDRPWRTDWPFYVANPFYHTSGDVPEHLNWAQIEAVAKLSLALAVELASDELSRDVVPPDPPTLLWVKADADSVLLRFRGPGASDLAEIRVYRPDTAWALPPAPDRALEPGTDSLRLYAASGSEHFCLTAADTTAPANESARSDCYGAWGGGRARLLIVDGFDRWGGSGSWGRPYHWFATYIGDALRDLGMTYETCANELVAEGTIRLQDYDAVFWILGDESTQDETFSASEQLRVREYLRAGGRLFVSGSELGWDLGYKGSSSDRAFLRDYLHAAYRADDSESYEVVGAPGSPFEGLRFSYGTIPFEEDYPDVLDPAAGAVRAFVYANGQGAGACFAGKIAGAEQECRVVTLGFPFETIDDPDVRAEIVRRTLRYFGLLETGVRELATGGHPRDFVLAVKAFPNPFNASATVEVRAEVGLPLVVRLWNARGRLVQELHRGAAQERVHRWTLRAEGLASGVYLIEAKQGGRRAVRRLTLVR